MRTLFKGGTVVSGTGTKRADLLVEDEKIVEAGKNLKTDADRVVDVTGTAPREAWDEYEDILRYTPYTQEELEQKNAPTWQDTMEAQVMYTALLTDTILEG